MGVMQWRQARETASERRRWQRCFDRLAMGRSRARKRWSRAISWVSIGLPFIACVIDFCRTRLQALSRQGHPDPRRAITGWARLSITLSTTLSATGCRNSVSLRIPQQIWYLKFGADALLP